MGGGGGYRPRFTTGEKADQNQKPGVMRSALIISGFVLFILILV